MNPWIANRLQPFAQYLPEWARSRLPEEFARAIGGSNPSDASSMAQFADQHGLLGEGQVNQMADRAEQLVRGGQTDTPGERQAGDPQADIATAIKGGLDADLARAIGDLAPDDRDERRRLMQRAYDLTRPPEEEEDGGLNLGYRPKRKGSRNERASKEELLKQIAGERERRGDGDAEGPGVSGDDSGGTSGGGGVAEAVRQAMEDPQQIERLAEAVAAKLTVM